MSTWLITAGAVILFVVLLSVVIVVSEKFLKPEKDVELDLSGAAPKTVKTGQSLLSACASAEIYLPAACGGKGTCGKCALKVRQGGSPLTVLEKVKLSSEDLDKGIRLACQVRVRENIQAEVPGGLGNASKFTARLTKIEQAAEDIKIMTFEYVQGKLLDFKPGQYIQCLYKLPWETLVRAYSVSSILPENKGFTLDIQAVPGGLMSGRLHSLKEGDEVEFNGAFGEMFLPEKIETDTVVFAAGGVGLAPMRSMIHALIEKDYKGKILLFHGARTRSRLYHEKEFTKLAEKYNNFKYIPALSEPLLNEGWTGFTGMAHKAVEECSDITPSSLVFLCGPSLMMEATEKILYKKGVSSDNILKDPFDF